MAELCPVWERLCAIVASNPNLKKFKEVAWPDKINCDFCCRNTFKAKPEMKPAHVCS